MRPYSNVSSLFNLGAGIEGLGYNTLNTMSDFANQQRAWQGALQSNQQAINNARASGGGFGSGLLGSVVNAGVGYALGGPAGAFSGFTGIPTFGIGGGTPGPLANWFSGLGTSPSSSLFGSSGFGNLVGTWNNTYSPPSFGNSGISMFGKSPFEPTAPVNYGGGVLGPRFSVF